MYQHHLGVLSVHDLSAVGVRDEKAAFGVGLATPLPIMPPVFEVADMEANGAYEVDGDAFKVLGFIPTGKARTAYTPTAIRAYCISSTGGEVLPFSVLPSAAGSRLGGFPDEAAPIWGVSPPTAKYCGCLGAIIARSMPLIPPAAIC